MDPRWLNIIAFVFCIGMATWQLHRESYILSAVNVVLACLQVPFIADYLRSLGT